MADLGYGGRHQRLRAGLRPLVDAGEAYCAELVCLEELDGRTRWIEPGTPWHLAHDRAAGPGMYRGPAHERCNTSEGAVWGNARRGRARSDEEAVYVEPSGYVL